VSHNRRRIGCNEGIDAAAKEVPRFIVANDGPIEKVIQELRIADRGKVELVLPEPSLNTSFFGQVTTYGRLAGAGFVFVSGAVEDGFASGDALLFPAGSLRICAKYCCTYC